MILGIYWLTGIKEEEKGHDMIFSSFNEAITAYDAGVIDLHAPIKARSERTGGEIITTTVGRIIFNLSLPKEIPYTNKQMRKRDLSELTADIINKLDQESAQEALDRMKQFGFHYATLSGISWGMDDLVIPKEKEEIIARAQKEIAELKKYYEEGLLTAQERRQRSVEVWTRAKNALAEIVAPAMGETNPVRTIFESGAKGSTAQLVQMAGMKGLVTNPAGEIIELPILSSFKEGFNGLEYFISTHGARKGTTDTALKTANAGYLTRRLIDVAQDVVIQDDDCGTKEGIEIRRNEPERLLWGSTLGVLLFSRTALFDIKAGRKTILKAGEIIDRAVGEEIEKELLIQSVWVRSPITCKSLYSICKACYGYNLGDNKSARRGDAVGIVAAQSIG